MTPEAPAPPAPTVSLPTVTVRPPAADMRWHPAWRIVFRLVFAAWMLLGFGIAWGVVMRLGFWLMRLVADPPAPGSGPAETPWWVSPFTWVWQGWQWFWSGAGGAPGDTGWKGMTTLVANTLGIEGNPRPEMRSGSGDQLYNWLQAGTCVGAAVLIAIAWTSLDWKNRAYPRLREFMMIWLRIVLGATMLSYGFAKVFPSQFSLPSVGKLLQPYGEASPMGLLWTFMGSSPAYTIFSGVAEALAGILLLFRPTAVLGAFIAAAVMTNVFLMNMCYDVPVKLYSFMYLMMAVTIAAPDVPRLVRVLVWRTAVERDPWRPRFRRARLNWAWRGVSVLGAVWLIGVSAHQGWQGYQQTRRGTRSEGLVGTWSVTSFKRNGVEQPALVTDGTRWKRVMFSAFGGAGIRGLSDVNQRFTFAHDEEHRIVTITPTRDRATGPGGETDEVVIASGSPVRLRYEETSALPSEEDGSEAPATPVLTLAGEVDGAELNVTLTKLDRSGFLLMHRGFHWVSQFPVNR